MLIETIYCNEIERDCNPVFENWLGFMETGIDRKYRYVYITRNLINNKVYIGQHSTKNFDDDYLGSGTIFLQAVEKYGKESFKKRICCFVNDKKDLDEAEKYWIAYWEAKERGYNIAYGGSENQYVHKSGVEHKLYGVLKSEEHKKHMRENHADFRGENHPFFGKHKSREHIEKFRESFRKNYKIDNHPCYNKFKSEETKKKIGETLRGRYRGELSPNYGRITSEETKNRYRETMSSKPILVCLHCGFKTKSKGNLNRWHNDNCKLK